MSLVLGVDSSTQSTKVEVRELDTGRVVARGRAAHPPTTPPRSEQQPSDWWQALVDAIGETKQRDIAAMSIAGQQHGMVVIDEAGAVLRPAKLWNDTESARDAQKLVRMTGSDRWAESVGSVPVAAFTISKLAWLARTEPKIFERIGTVLLPHDWLTFRLTNRRVTDRGDASGTGYWSPRKGAWRPDLLRLVDDQRSESDWLDLLPEVLGPTDMADWVTASVLGSLGLRGRPLVGPGTGDNMAAALGMGLRPGEVAFSIGTSGTVYAPSPKPTADSSGAVAGFADATGHFLPLVCTLNATKVTELAGRLLGLDHDRLAELAIDAAPGAHGLVLLPYLDGERTPNRPNAKGVLTGLGSDTQPADVARAAFEGVICSLLDGLDALIEAGIKSPRSELRLVGGGAKSPAYRQLLADLSGLPVRIPPGDEHVATGACIQAAAVATEADPLEVAEAWGLRGGPMVEPRSIDRDEVRAAYAKVRG